MKKSAKALTTLLSATLLLGGIMLTGVSPLDVTTMSEVHAEDVNGDVIDDGEVIEDADGEDEYLYYEGEIDIYTGLPKEVAEQNASGIVKVNEDTSYDVDNSYFVYSVGTGTLGCSVADGMVTTSPVKLAKTGEFNVSIYKDGSKLTGFPNSVSDPGTYTAISWDDNSEKQLMSFKIVNKVTGNLSQYVLPSGFFLKSVTLDGVEPDREYGMVDMTEEGYYDIKYVCNATNIEYSLTVTVDHIPPQITLEGVDKDNKANGPVTIKGLQSKDSVVVFLDDYKTNLKTGNKLTESGDYRLYVYDEAGNVIEKDFQIMLYLNVRSVFLFIAFVLIIAGVFVALYITRKNLRVR